MRWPIATWRMLRAFLHALHGMAQVLLLWRYINGDSRHQRIARWSTDMLGALGVQVELSGHFRPGPNLLVANHVSWLDILAIHSVCPRARFVSKSEVRHWPLIGRLVDCAETLYLERERKRDALRVVHQIAEALRAGAMVAVFPEGTTGEGKALLPFHANLLQAAIATATPIQPAVLHYRDARESISSAVTWVGADTLLQSIWRIASARTLRVDLYVLAPLRVDHADRRALAQRLQQLMAAALDQAHTKPVT